MKSSFFSKAIIEWDVSACVLLIDNKRHTDTDTYVTRSRHATILVSEGEQITQGQVQSTAVGIT